MPNIWESLWNLWSTAWAEGGMHSTNLDSRVVSCDNIRCHSWWRRQRSAAGCNHDALCKITIELWHTGGECKARWLVLQKYWLILLRFRQLVPGQARKVDTKVPHSLIVEPGKHVTQEKSLFIARTLCQQNQAESTIPVEVYNPTDEPVHLFKHIT